jgi:hypothetical protein
MVFWPFHSLLVWIERMRKFFEFGLLFTKEVSPTAPNELNYALPWLLMAQIKKKTSRYFLSKQEGTV